MVVPPPDVGNQPSAAGATRATAAASATARGAPQPSALAPALDRADISRLDVAGALQILIAEVREAFALLLSAADTANPANAGDPANANANANANAGNAEAGDAAYTANIGTAITASLDGPASAARVLMQMLLQALPDSADDGVWSERLTQAEAALESAIERAIDVIAAWRDVPPAVLQSAQESAELALQVLGESQALGYESNNALWLHPEWLALRPLLTRFRRRRRRARRRLTDPDYESGKWKEIDDYAQ